MIRSDLFWYGNNLRMKLTYREENLLDYLFGGFRSTLNSIFSVCSVLLVWNRCKQRVWNQILFSVLNATLISAFSGRFEIHIFGNLPVTWGPWSSTIVDSDRRKTNVVGSRDGETRGVLTAIIAVLMHWLLTNFCYRHIASTAGSNHGVSKTGEKTQLLLRKQIERCSATACNCVRPCVSAWHSKLKYLRMLYHAGVHPPFGFLSSTKARQRNAQSARTLH